MHWAMLHWMHKHKSNYRPQQWELVWQWLWQEWPRQGSHAWVGPVEIGWVGILCCGPGEGVLMVHWAHKISQVLPRLFAQQPSAQARSSEPSFRLCWSHSWGGYCPGLKGLNWSFFKDARLWLTTLWWASSARMARITSRIVAPFWYTQRKTTL